MENQHGFQWLYLEDHFERKLQLPAPPLNDSHEHSQNNILELYDNQLYSNEEYYNFPNIEFKDFEDLIIDLSLFDANKLQSFCDETEIHNQPLNSMNNCFDGCSNIGNYLNIHEEGKKQSGRTNSAVLELDEIQKYFDLPITKAAKEMKVGLTVLKKRCRELNIMRWPHRKIKSLKSLIHNVKELGLTEEIHMLEEHKRLIEKLPQIELTERTKKLRQACFKANYKKRRSLEISGCP